MKVTSVIHIARQLILAIFCISGVSGTLLAQPDVSISFVSQFGSEGDGLGQFRVPTDVAVDSQGRLLVGDLLNQRVQRCTFAGQCEVFKSPAGDVGAIVIGNNGEVLLVKSEGNVIQICDETGACSGFFGGSGSEPGQFSDPRDAAFDSMGRVVIADRGNDRVQFCDLDGNCTAFGSFNSGPSAVPGEFWEPASVATDGKGVVYIGETGDEVISVCNESGACSARLGVEGTAVGQFKSPLGLGITSRGDLVVLESSNNRIQVCDVTGSCVAFGQQGTGSGQFRFPSGMHVDDSDRIIVTDSDNNRIQVLQITYNSPLPEPEFIMNPGLNGAWANLATLGQGFFIDIFPDIPLVFLAWFTWETAQQAPLSSTTADNWPEKILAAAVGDENHRWITAQGPFSGNSAVLEVTLTTGGLFDDPTPVTNSPSGEQGTITLTFTDCKTGTIDYEFTAIGLSGSVPIQRLANDNVDLCDSLNTAAQEAR